MNQQSERLESPCVRQCTLNDADVCIGCGRNLEEIKAWAVASVDGQHVIKANAAARLVQIKRRPIL